MSKEKPIAVFMSGITHEVKTMEEKIRFFSDCLDLLVEAQNFPLCRVGVNARILCHILNQLANSDSLFRFSYLNEINKYYGEFLSPTTTLNKKFQTQLEVVLSELNKIDLDKAYDKKKRATYDSSKLKVALKEAIKELDEKYFKVVLDILTTAIFCKEDLYQHDHIEAIETCANEIITEFHAIGYDKTSIKKIFDEVIKSNFRDFKALTPSQVYQIPVPKELYKLQRELTYAKYKNRVQKYLKERGLKNQFEDLVNLHYQKQRERTYVFKVSPLWMESDRDFVYSNVRFSKDLKSKYVNKKTRFDFVKYFDCKDEVTFCEVSVFSGFEKEALMKASNSVREALNFLDYHIAYNDYRREKRPRVDFTRYVVVDNPTVLTGRNLLMRVHKNDLTYFKYLEDLEKLKHHPTVEKYLQVDKVFFEAFTEQSEYNAISELWRYCESLFTDEGKTPDKMIEKLISYRLSKANFHHLLGLQKMLYSYNYAILHDKKEKVELAYGIPYDEFRTKVYLKMDVEQYVKQWVKKNQHPAIRRQKMYINEFNVTQRNSKLKEYYFRILKTANIQRNLYQHNNVMIDQLRSIWNEETVRLVETVRWFIIEDLKKNPGIDKIESLFDI